MRAGAVPLFCLTQCSLVLLCLLPTLPVASSRYSSKEQWVEETEKHMVPPDAPADAFGWGSEAEKWGWVVDPATILASEQRVPAPAMEREFRSWFHLLSPILSTPTPSAACSGDDTAPSTHPVGAGLSPLDTAMDCSLLYSSSLTAGQPFASMEKLVPLLLKEGGVDMWTVALPSFDGSLAAEAASTELGSGDGVGVPDPAPYAIDDSGEAEVKSESIEEGSCLPEVRWDEAGQTCEPLCYVYRGTSPPQLVAATDTVESAVAELGSGDEGGQGFVSVVVCALQSISDVCEVLQACASMKKLAQYPSSNVFTIVLHSSVSSSGRTRLQFFASGARMLAHDCASVGTALRMVAAQTQQAAGSNSCPTCGLSGMGEDQLRMHYPLYHQCEAPPRHDCSLCGRSACSYRAFAVHLHNHHGPVDDREPAYPAFAAFAWVVCQRPSDGKVLL